MSIPRSCHNFVSFLPYMHESMLFLNFHSKKLSFKTSSMWAWIPTLYKYDWAQTSINEMMSLLCRASSVYHIKWVHLRYPVIIITQYCPPPPNFHYALDGVPNHFYQPTRGSQNSFANHFCLHASYNLKAPCVLSNLLYNSDEMPTKSPCYNQSLK